MLLLSYTKRQAELKDDGELKTASVGSGPAGPSFVARARD